MGASPSKEEAVVEQVTCNAAVVPPSILELLPMPMPPSSAVSRFMQLDHPRPSWDAIITQSPGQHLLNDYLEPGLWLAGSSTTEHSTVLFHKHRLPTIIPSEDGAPLNVAAQGSDTLCLSHSFYPNTHLNILAPSHGIPSVTLMQTLPPFAQFCVNVNANGHGWMKGSLETSFPYPSWLGIRKILVGSGAEFQLFWDTPMARLVPPPSSVLPKASGNHPILDAPIATLHGLAGIDVHGTLLAVTADIPITDEIPPQHQPSSSEPPVLRLLRTNNVQFIVHGNLNRDEDQPPLWFTALAKPALGDFSMQICHSCTFDRPFLSDLLDDNCIMDEVDRIRNTLTWTVEMSTTSTGRNYHAATAAMTSTASTTAAERRVLDDEDGAVFHHDTASGNSINDTLPTRLRAGMTWQFNQNVAIKAVTTPTEGNIRGAIILQRWKQPQLVCSLIGEYNMCNQQSQFVGVGIELGSMSSHALAALPKSWQQHTD